MRMHVLVVPTYYGEHQDQPEFDEPRMKVIVRQEDGVRLLLGGPSAEQSRWADILIERRANGWIVILHPVGGSDPSGCVALCDDGRSYLAPELEGGPTPTIEVAAYDDLVRTLDCRTERDP